MKTELTVMVMIQNPETGETLLAALAEKSINDFHLYIPLFFGDKYNEVFIPWCDEEPHREVFYTGSVL